MWSVLAAVLRAPISIVTSIILYRILGPSIIGLAGMIGTVTLFFDYITELGIGAGIIRTVDITRRQINDLFLINFYASAFLSILLIILSPQVAAFFQEPQLTIYFKVISFVPVLRAFYFTSNAILTKNLEFKKLAWATWVPNVAGSFGTVGLVFLIGGLPALVAGYLFSTVLRTIMLLSMARWFPTSLVFSFRRIKPILKFSIFIHFEKILAYGMGNMDRLFIGHYLGSVSFGYYEAAKKITSFLYANVSRSIGRVAFPSLAKLQDDISRMKAGYLEVVRHMALITFPIMTGMIIVSPDLFILAFGEEWAPSVRVFQLLCIAGAVQSIETLTGSVLYSLGKSKIRFAYVALLNILYISCYLVVWRYGLIGIVLGFVGVTLFVYPTVQTVINRYLGISFAEFVAALRTQLLGSVTMYVLLTACRPLFLNAAAPESVGIVAMQIVAGALYFVGFVWIFNRKLFQSFLDTARLLLERKANPVESA